MCQVHYLASADATSEWIGEKKPVAASRVFFDLTQERQQQASERTWFALQLSLTAAALTPVLALILMMPAAYTLSRRHFRGRLLAASILEFPMIVSLATGGTLC